MSDHPTSAQYQQSFALCDIHQPDVWEGDGSCVLCEASTEHERLKQCLLELSAEKEGAAYYQQTATRLAIALEEKDILIGKLHQLIAQLRRISDRLHDAFE